MIRCAETVRYQVSAVFIAVTNIIMLLQRTMNACTYAVGTAHIHWQSLTVANIAQQVNAPMSPTTMQLQAEEQFRHKSQRKTGLLTSALVKVTSSPATQRQF